MKYVVTEQEDGSEEIFLFPENIDHDCFAEVVGYIKNQSYGDWQRIGRYVISAGFVSNGMVCHGGSETLGLCSRGEVDTELLREVFQYE